MYEDPVVEEVHRIREALSASFDHDMDRIVAYLMERQGKDGRKVVSRAPKRVQPLLPNLMPGTTADAPPISATSPSVSD